MTIPFLRLFHRPKRAWVFGGLIGMLVCAVLYVIYASVLTIFRDGPIGQAILYPAMVTGHLFILMWGFVVPYGLFCPNVLQVGGWSRDPMPGYVACVDHGQPGYCDYFMYPEAHCANISEGVTGIIALIVFFALYFAIGAGIAIFFERRNAKKSVS